MQRLFIFCLLCISFIGWTFPSVDVGISSQDACVGEALLFQISVSDAQNIEPIHFPKIDGMNISVLSPSRNQSSQITIVNGKMTKSVKNDVLYRYRLTPMHEGRLVIPKIRVVADGTQFYTPEVRINATKGEEITDIALELSFSDSVCYVGQPLMATWRWYIGRKTYNYSFQLPLLEDKRMSWLPYETPIDPQHQEHYRRIPNPVDENMIGLLKQVRRNGILVNCLEFSRPFVIQAPGTFELNAGTLLCDIEDRRAVRRSRRNGFGFSSFFDDTPTKTVSIPGNSITLQVKQLPEEGRPSDFSGIIGRCEIESEVTPLEVNVGDPMVLTVRIKGLAYPEAVKMPSLSSQTALVQNFRISDEEPGRVKDGAKLYQCTLRAGSDSIQEIPGIVLSYFDTQKGEYQRIQSASIPIKVHAVKTVTVSDVQGNLLPQAELVGSEIKKVEEGIAHNASVERLLGDKRAGFALWHWRNWRCWATISSVSIYGLLWLLRTILRMKQANPEEQRLRRQGQAALARLLNPKKLESGALFENLQIYLRALLHLGEGALTWNEVKEALTRKKTSPQLIKEMESLFQHFEMAAFSGLNSTEDSLKDQVSQVVKQLNKIGGGL